MNIIKKMLVAAAIVGVVACSDETSTSHSTVNDESKELQDNAPGDSMVFFNPALNLAAYQQVSSSIMQNMPTEPTMLPVSLNEVFRLFPFAEKRLKLRGKMEQCNYYILLWKHLKENVYYNLDYVGLDSVVITRAISEQPAVLAPADSVQEFFVIESCGYTLDINAPVVVKDVFCGADDCASFPASMVNGAWYRSDLNEAMEQCMANCMVDVENDSFGEKMENMCSSRCDSFEWEGMSVCCSYNPEDLASGVSCSFECLEVVEKL